VSLGACERERRTLQPEPSATPGTAVPTAMPDFASHQGNAQSLADGKRMFRAFNCNGCHANGGGDKGPALMDDEWIYGSAPAEIYASIAGGTSERHAGVRRPHRRRRHREAGRVRALALGASRRRTLQPAATRACSRAPPRTAPTRRRASS
jgi:cytochrome c oxidase cbb3-type subunit 3